MPTWWQTEFETDADYVGSVRQADASCHRPCIGCGWAWGNPGRGRADRQCHGLTRWRRKPILKTLFARQGQFTDIHNGFHLRGLQAGDEGLNGQTFVAEGEKGGVHGVRGQCSRFDRVPKFYATGTLRPRSYV